ncbi:hypothetical protein ACFVU2_18335 [Leifsonia sp. NPDC058194]|uniref:hypothetical protein n=1 Tax=Leifsonia sp. NPDC058194 TaxID=3346374 RepID=UPI0036DB4E20
MNRILRAAVLTAVVAVGAAVATPSAANAATPVWEIRVGHVFTGEPGTFPAGTEVRVHVTPLAEVDGHCLAETVVGRGVAEPDGSYAIRMDRTVADGLVNVETCTDDVAKATATVRLVDNPFEPTSLSAGDALPLGAAVTGIGSPGSTVEARDQDGMLLGTAVVGTDAAWTMTPTGLAQGPLNITFTQDAKMFDIDVIVVEDSESTPLVDPLIGGAAALTFLSVGALHLRRRRSNAIA